MIGPNPRKPSDRYSTMRRSHFPAGPTSELVAPRVNTLSKLLTKLGAQYAKKHFGLTRVEWQTITLLGAFQPISIKDLAGLAMLDAAQVSRAVARLQSSGLVKRGKSRYDSREAQIGLSSEGEAVHAQLHQAALRRNTLLFEGFAGEEIQAAFSLLDRLIASAEAQLET